MDFSLITSKFVVVALLVADKTGCWSPSSAVDVEDAFWSRRQQREQCDRRHGMQIREQQRQQPFCDSMSSTMGSDALLFSKYS